MSKVQKAEKQGIEFAYSVIDSVGPISKRLDRKEAIAFWGMFWSEMAGAMIVALGFDQAKALRAVIEASVDNCEAEIKRDEAKMVGGLQ